MPGIARIGSQQTGRSGRAGESVRLYLSRRGEQGVRIGTFLASQEAWVPAYEIASRTGVSQGQVPGVVADLGRAGLLINRSGAGGGCRLARPPDEISALEVVEALEGPILRDICVLDRERCPDDGACGLHDAWARARAALLEALASVSLADLEGAGWTVREEAAR